VKLWLSQNKESACFFWCLQAQGKSQEQQLIALEAALQKGNQVTVSMTERVASAMSEAQAQVGLSK
jgi:hypothetical protein